MIYFDNGATSYPKPVNVLSNTVNALKNYSFNSGRGGYAASVHTAEKIYSVREKIGAMFGFEPQNIAFTMNCTQAVNMAIKGSVKPGDHVIISALEHNAVWRVVNHLKNDGIIQFDVADYSFDAAETALNFERLIRKNTSLIVCMAASNVFGVVFSIEKIGEIAKQHNIRFIVDAAQGAGVIPIDAKKNHIDILCAPGHKCLFGNMGTGFIAVKEGTYLNTLIDGGTGSESTNPNQPDFFPDRLEAGTLNNSGILSLGAGIDFINSKGMEHIYQHELAVTDCLFNGLSKNSDAVLYCPKPEKNKSVPIISFNYKDYSSEKTAALLAEHNIAVRAGLHCSPLAHRFFNTLERGTVRLCPSVFTTRRDCEFFLKSLKKI